MNSPSKKITKSQLSVISWAEKKVTKSQLLVMLWAKAQKWQCPIFWLYHRPIKGDKVQLLQQNQGVQPCCSGRPWALSVSLPADFLLPGSTVAPLVVQRGAVTISGVSSNSRVPLNIHIFLDVRWYKICLSGDAGKFNAAPAGLFLFSIFLFNHKFVVNLF